MTEGDGFPTSTGSETLTKDRLATQLQELSGFTHEECLRFLKDFLDEIQQSLVRNETVKILGLGTFKLRDKGARPGQNPTTGEVVPIDPRRVVTFHASHKLRKRIAADAHKRQQRRSSPDSE